MPLAQDAEDELYEYITVDGSGVTETKDAGKEQSDTKSSDKKAEKNKEVVQKYEFWGLVLLVAIPLPGTGAWTGALVAAMMDMRLKRAMPAIILGVLIAGVIVTTVTYGAGALF